MIFMLFTGLAVLFVIYVALITALAGFVGRRFRSKKRARFIQVAIFFLALVIPIVDHFWGVLHHRYLCEHAGTGYIQYGEIPYFRSIYTQYGVGSAEEILRSGVPLVEYETYFGKRMAAVLEGDQVVAKPLKESVSDFVYGSEMNQRISDSIFKQRTYIDEVKSGRVVSEYVNYRFRGGWLARSLPRMPQKRCEKVDQFNTGVVLKKALSAQSTENRE